MAGTTTTVQPSRLGVTTRVLDVLIWGGVAVCLVRLFAILTGIVPMWWWDDAWVDATAMPQILQFDYQVTEEDPTKADIRLLPLWLRMLGSVSIVLFTVMFVLILGGARLMAKRAMQGAPFAPDVAGRLRSISAAVISLAVIRVLVDVATISGVLSWEPPDSRWHGLAIGTNLPSISLSLVIAAVVARVLASAVERGARLEKEMDGLV
ncbi:DUF2975 domain-containing protein [Ornithinimicrobium cerasi]|uniref:DUF2975 domain-containing protein n=1 Tax=Ornithinimicrobium cerasi TaxID=2248773 RepID=UPI000EFF7C45|nr:DUF2975 domain-containing protein [Ornithinimicrobium cerasi]